MTGRRSGHDESAAGTRRPPRPGPGDGQVARGSAVAPQPRPGPGPDAATVEVEPTTGAPVDAVPRRVPVRQPRTLRRDGEKPDDDGFFWAPIEQVHWDGTPLRKEPKQRLRARRRRRPARAPAAPDPIRGLAVLLALSLVAAFFAWVSAGPLWLAVGHSTAGTVVVTDCSGGGLTQRCRGIFTADDDRFRTHGVRVSGVPAERTAAGSVLPARVTGPDADTAYADTGVGRHLRWLLGLLAVVGCAAGIVRWTGATRLADPRQRRWATGGGCAGPVLITLGFLASTW
ncbi:hypothetical protein [Micromonospora sp. HUAS LYJ1]|uniref:hypothetical protein n=1 Tax=Micromonospora sp. HUAS LYJ1 TaxID=3061626 RepID=UPI0026710993|nr:hypothetical protein [Micromonospora sp. HUAS LYJ1]WKU04077.1 hypothetical protein Q2K16_25120 [Micromonospora sp. HUAS LYJ1]